MSLISLVAIGPWQILIIEPKYSSGVITVDLIQGSSIFSISFDNSDSNSSSATCNMDFYDTRDGELVVNYLKGIKGSLGSNSQDLINVLMRKVTRRIPYTK